MSVSNRIVRLYKPRIFVADDEKAVRDVFKVIMDSALRKSRLDIAVNVLEAITRHCELHKPVKMKKITGIVKRARKVSKLFL